MNQYGKYYDSDPELTKFGYFEVDNFKSFSKYEAWQYANDNGIPIKRLNYNFNDEYMNQFVWSGQPTNHCHCINLLVLDLWW